VIVSHHTAQASLKAHVTQLSNFDSLCNTQLKPSYMGFDCAPIDDAPDFHPRWGCTNQRLCRCCHLLFLISRVLKFLLQRETNWTSALFQAGDISTHIQSITDWHLLFPMSQSHTALGTPYGGLPDSGSNMRFPRSAGEIYARAGACFRPESFWTAWPDRTAGPLAFNAVLAQVFQLFSLVTYDGLSADSHLFAILAI